MQKDLRDTTNTTAGNVASSSSHVSPGSHGAPALPGTVDKLAGEFVLTNPAIAPLEPASVGELLQAARIQTGLSVADVANRLRMGVKQIDALERADYQALPAGTFLRGFVRNYAKVVGVDPNMALATLERTHQNAQALAASIVVAPTIAASPINLHSSAEVLASPKARIVVALVVVLLLAGAAWYWWANVRPHLAEGGRAKPNATTTSADTADTSAAPAATNEYTVSPTTLSTDTALPTSGVTGEPVSQPNVTPNSAATTAATPAATPATPNDASTLKKSESAPVTPLAPPIANIAEPTPPILAAKSAAVLAALALNAAEPAKPSRPGETGRIGFTFSGESWVEVTDSTGRTILSRRYKAGETDEAAGRGPFSIVVGNATVTRMAYNGREFDLTPHRRGNSTVARVNVK